MRLKTRLVLSAFALSPAEYKYNLTFGDKRRISKEEYKLLKSKSDFFNITFKSKKNDNDFFEISERLVNNCIELTTVELRTLIYLLLKVGDQLFNEDPLSYKKIADDINRFIDKYGYKEYLGLEEDHIEKAVKALCQKRFLEKRYQDHFGKHYVINAFYYGWEVSKEECDQHLNEVNKDKFYEKDLVRELHPYDKIDLIIKKEERLKEQCYLFFKGLDTSQ